MRATVRQEGVVGYSVSLCFDPLGQASTHCTYCFVLSISYLRGNAMLAISLWVLSSHIFQRSGGENDIALLTEFAFQCSSDIIWILLF